MRSERLALAQIHAHEARSRRGQVAQAAVDESGRACGGAAAEIVLLDQRDLQAAQRGVARDAAADDPAADDDDVERRLSCDGVGHALEHRLVQVGRACPGRSALGWTGVATLACGRDMVDMTMTVLAVAGGQSVQPVRGPASAGALTFSTAVG